MKEKSFLEKYLVNIGFIIIGLILVGYVVFSFYYSEPMTEDEYRGRGEQYDNRWGQ